MFLAKNLRYLRHKFGYSQDEIAEHLGYKSFTTIQKWESGVAEPSLKVLSRLSELYETDLDQLTKTDLTLEKDQLNPRSELIRRAYSIPEEHIPEVLLVMDKLSEKTSTPMSTDAEVLRQKNSN